MSVAISQIERHEMGGKKRWSHYFILSLCLHILTAFGLAQINILNTAPSKPVTITFELAQPFTPALQAKSKSQNVTLPPISTQSAQQSLKHKNRPKISDNANQRVTQPSVKPLPPIKDTTPSIAFPIQKTEGMGKTMAISTPSMASESTTETRSEAIASVPVKPLAAPTVEHAKKVNSAAKASWQGLLLGQLQRYKRYPKAAKEMHQEGTAYLRFSMNREGKVLSARLQKSAGSSWLDEETLAMIRRAEPLPTPPDEVPGNIIELVVPVQFLLKK
jgi:protein TonB